MLILKIFASKKPKYSGIEKAGMIIGILERAIILTFILLEEYTAVGIVLTAKSIARFEELKDREFSEYYLIGTLSSFFFSIICGIILKEILYVIKT
ncbi:MAG: hypothetical protein N2042_02570 [Thermodesulfovibrio sp.]|nr:hypothetical protein [Thermodesulfovibrio sp.]MCX7724115.1 hypothetical protein [Thermodesulfovibrio sp.]MDW7999350.1 hypothetical protein [Thermodesulfovibrio sp.]